MALIKCTECGSDVSEKASVCPKCGCPVDVTKDVIARKNKKKAKIMIFAGIGVVIIAILLLLVIKFANRPGSEGYYGNTTWGMSAEQLKDELGDSAIINDEHDKVWDTINDYEDKIGINAIITYDCKDNSLSKISISLLIEDDSTYTDSELFDEYAEKFNELYGKSEKGLNTTIWHTSKSKIDLGYLIDNVIVMTYEDITKVEE